MEDNTNKKTEYTISELMARDHERLTSMFNDFKHTKDKDIKQASKIFSKFHNELMNHEIVENHIIKSAFGKKGKEKNKNLLPIAQSLEMDHVKIMNLMSNISGEIKSNKAIDTSDFYLTLQKHRNIEDRLLYPELDRVLSEKEKLKIFEIIKNR
jgi:hypothetical protein|tara:strand:- start:92 stop:553 length:462 start_codon:yes stop_codon:yes gene_type:complete